MKKIYAFVLFLFSIFTLSACEELEGFDFSDLSQWIEDLQGGNGQVSDWQSSESNNEQEGKHTIYFDLMGLGKLESYELKNVEVIPNVLPTPNVVDGYVFDGWYYYDDFSLEVSSGERIYENITIYAKIVPIMCNVKCIYDGTIYGEYSVQYGWEVSSYPDFIPEEGYVFLGWGINGVVWDGYFTEDTILEPVIRQMDLITIDEFLNKKDVSSSYFLKGIVTACPNDFEPGLSTSYILSDETGHVFVYPSANVCLGDEVLILATYKQYIYTPEVGAVEYFKVISQNNDYLKYCGEVYEYNILDMKQDQIEMLDYDKIVEKYCNKHLKIDGLLVKEGLNYYLTGSYNGTYRIKIKGNKTKLSALENKYVDIYGFVREVFKDRSLYLQIHTVEEASETLESMTLIVERIRDEVKIEKCIYDKTFVLKQNTAYLPDATIEYSIVGNSQSSTMNGYELTVKNSLVTSPEEVTIKVAVHYKNEVYFEYFTYVVEPIQYTSIADFIAMKDTVNKCLLKGYIINTTSTMGHMLADESGIVFAYVKADVNVGDEVVISAIYQNYYGVHEIGVGSEWLETLSSNNDISSYIPEPIEQNIDDWYKAINEEEFDENVMGEYLSGKLIHLQGYYYGRNQILCSDNSTKVLYIYSSTQTIDIEPGTLVDIYGYFRGARKTFQNVNFQVDRIEAVKSDAIEVDLETFYGMPEEYLGKKVVFEGIITEKVEEGLFIATQIKNKKEHKIYVEGNFNIGDKYSYVGHIELFGNNNYKVTRKNIHMDGFTADTLRKISTDECIILDSSIEYETYYGSSLYSDGVITNCEYENNVLTFYLSTHPYDFPEKTVVFVLSVEVKLDNINTTTFVGKKVTGKLYKETYESINTHFILDLSLITIG